MLGRSGSGKSTFLRALGALDADFEGHLRVPERRAIVFQDPRLLPWQRVLTNVTVGLPATARCADQARAALGEVNWQPRPRCGRGRLSGGEAQRVALARALVREPELLLLDEPFGALDALTRIKMHGLLLALCRRHTPAVLLVTHDVDEAILLADRVIVLTDGAISLDVEVTVPKPRARDSHEFATLRRRLLAELGVTGEVQL